MKNIILLLLSFFLLFLSCEQAEEPVVFRIGVADSVSIADPHDDMSRDEAILVSALFEGLVRYDARASELVPALAESWTVEDDVVTFQIRKAVWSDGSKITARQFVDSWLRLLDPKRHSEAGEHLSQLISGADKYYNGIAGIESVDLKAESDNRLHIKLVGDYHTFLRLAAQSALSVLPLHIIERNEKNWTSADHLVVSGPFKPLVPENPSDGGALILQKNDFYWDLESIEIDSLEFIKVMHKEGQLDWVPNIKVRSLQAGDNVHISTGTELYFLLFNGSEGAMADSTLRRIAAAAIDSTDVVKAVPGEELLLPVKGIIADYDKSSNLHPSSGLIEAAKSPIDGSLIETIKLPHSLSYLFNSSDLNRAVYENLKIQFKEKLGIQLYAIEVDWDTYQKYLYTGEYDIARISWRTEAPSFRSLLRLFRSGEAFFNVDYSNDLVDDLLEMSSNPVLSLTESTALLGEVEDIIINSEVLITPLFKYGAANQIDLQEWEGWFSNTLDIHDLKWLKKRAD